MITYAAVSKQRTCHTLLTHQSHCLHRVVKNAMNYVSKIPHSHRGIIGGGRVHTTTEKNWWAQSQISMRWSRGQLGSAVSAQFLLSDEAGGHPISASEFRSPPVMWNLSQVKYLPVDAVKESKEPGDDERQLSAGLSVCSILMGSPDTHKSITEEAPKQMSARWTRLAWPKCLLPKQCFHLQAMCCTN